MWALIHNAVWELPTSLDSVIVDDFVYSFERILTEVAVTLQELRDARLKKVVRIMNQVPAVTSLSDALPLGLSDARLGRRAG